MPDLSLSIDGTGYFILSRDGELLYTRKGDFCVDENGTLINGLGYRVQAYEPVPGTGGFNQGALSNVVAPPTGPSGGMLSDLSIDASGVLEVTYTDGDRFNFGKLALVTFNSPQNLLTEPGATCRTTFASGNAHRGEAGEGLFGTIQPGLLGSFACDQGRVDARVAGDGYFRLNNAGTTHYDTTIILGLDANGYFVDDHGYRVTGFAADADGLIVPSLVDLVSTATQSIPPAPTSSVALDANLDAGAGPPAVAPFDANDPLSYNFSTDVTVYDSLGGSHALTFYFVSTGPDSWNLHPRLDGLPMFAGGSPHQVLTFSGGALSSAGFIVYDPVALPHGPSDLSITLTTTGITQTGAAFAVPSLVQNGYAWGVATATQVAANGEIRLDYSNGRNGVLLGQIVLATFQSPGSLARSTDGQTWLETVGSGLPTVDVPGAAGLGDVVTSPR